jgi:hypothetical protein
VGDDRALGIGDAHLAEAEATAALGDARLGAQVSSCAACGELGMNCSMISRRVGTSFTCRPYAK